MWIIWLILGFSMHGLQASLKISDKMGLAVNGVLFSLASATLIVDAWLNRSNE